MFEKAIEERKLRVLLVSVDGIDILQSKKAFSSGCGWLETPGVIQVENGDKTLLVKTERKSH